MVQPKHQRANRDSPAYWIAEACTRARERAELAPIEVAVAVFNRKGKVVDATTVLRFEKGKRYPDLLDELVEGYARKTGRDAPDLWMDAILLWRQYRAHPISGVAEDPDPPEDADAA